MKLLRLVSLAAVVMGLAFASQASADVHYLSPSSVTANVNGLNAYVGPYHLMVDGFNGNKQFDATCITFYNDVTPPESWPGAVYNGNSLPNPATVSWVGNIPYYNGGLNLFDTQLLGKAASLNALFYDPAYSGQWGAIHTAIFDLFTGQTPTGVAATLTGNATVADASTYKVIIPTSMNLYNGGPNYHPQVFLTQTPEPCSLALLGLGVAVVGIRRRRRKA